MPAPALRLRGGVELEEINNSDEAGDDAGMDAAALGALRSAVEKLTHDPSAQISQSPIYYLFPPWPSYLHTGSSKET